MKQNHNVILLVILAMLLAGATVLVMLCARAAGIQREADELTRAVTAASSAADAFYREDDIERLAQLLSGDIAQQKIIVPIDGGGSMTVTILPGLPVETARIEVYYSERMVYSLLCERCTGGTG